MGSHLKPGRSRFAWELARYVIAWAFVVAAVVGLFWLLQEVLPEVVADQTTTTTTSAPATTTTVAQATTTTVAAGESTTTVAAETTTTTTLPVVRPPEEVTVLVLNSTLRVGLAARVAADLHDLGYIVEQPANARPLRQFTTILHAEGYGLEALELAETAFEDEAIVGIDTEDLTSDDVNIVVVLGSSYDS